MAGSITLSKRANAKTPRRFERQRVEALMYVDLGSENGGFPIDISEDGMSFQGIRPLEINQDVWVTFKFYGVDETVTAAAKIVWLTESRKGGGLRFIDLPEDSRRLINDWMSLQREGSSSKETPDAATPHTEIEEKGLRSASIVPGAADRDNSPAPATKIAAGPSSPLPLAPLQLTPPSSPLPTGRTIPTITPSFTVKSEAHVQKSSPKQRTSRSEDSKRTARTPILLATSEKKHSGIRTLGIVLGAAAFLAIMIDSGKTLWPLRGVLLAPLVRNTPAETVAQPAPEPSAARPPEQAVAVDPSDDAQPIDSLPLAPIANGRENLTMPVRPTVPMSAPKPPAEDRALLAPRISRQTTLNVTVPKRVETHPSVPAVVTARNEQPVMAPPSPISKDTNQLSGVGTTGGKTSPLPASPPVIPVTPTGSIEIVSDPYPSIRMPADLKGRTSRPGTSLQMGRLVAKVEPVYPAEALRQRIAGTAKVHVIIGRSGVVDKAELVDGPRLLAESVLGAVQNWRFEPTLLGGEPIEVEEDISVVFRIAGPPAPVN
jgi:TonB family protein